MTRAVMSMRLKVYIRIASVGAMLAGVSFLATVHRLGLISRSLGLLSMAVSGNHVFMLLLVAIGAGALCYARRSIAWGILAVVLGLAFAASHLLPRYVPPGPTGASGEDEVFLLALIALGVTSLSRARDGLRGLGLTSGVLVCAAAGMGLLRMLGVLEHASSLMGGVMAIGLLATGAFLWTASGRPERGSPAPRPTAQDRWLVFGAAGAVCLAVTLASTDIGGMPIVHLDGTMVATVKPVVWSLSILAVVSMLGLCLGYLALSRLGAGRLGIAAAVLCGPALWPLLSAVPIQAMDILFPVYRAIPFSAASISGALALLKASRIRPSRMASAAAWTLMICGGVSFLASLVLRHHVLFLIHSHLQVATIAAYLLAAWAFLLMAEGAPEHAEPVPD